MTRSEVAGYLNCSPGKPESWPLDVIDSLIALRDNMGEKAFLTELSRMKDAPRSYPATKADLDAMEARIVAAIRSIRP